MKRGKWRSAALCLALILSLAGCGKETDAATKGTGSQSSESTEVGELQGSSSVEDLSESTVETAEESTSEESASAEIVQEEITLKEACEEFFTLGVGINGSDLSNLCTYNGEYMELAAKHFNSVTLSNLMKSCYILQQGESKKNIKEGNGEPVLSYESIDDTLRWCQENGIGMRGHTLVWHVQAPGWFFREGYEDNGAYVDKETMLFRMESYIRQLMTHCQEEFPGVIYCWDVVNEAVDPDKGDKETDFCCRTEFDGGENPWYVTIGPEYVEYAFTYARKYAAEGVKLFYNDFNTYQSEKCKYILALCKGLKEKGLIDGIGMQGYYSVTYPSLTSIESAIRRYSTLGLELQVTELSVSIDDESEKSLAEQGERYADLMYSFCSLDEAFGGPANITNVTFFGLIDHYREGDKTNTRLFDKYYEPKPAYEKVLEQFLVFKNRWRPE